MAYVFDLTIGTKPRLVSISVTTMPTKTTYKAGESFSPAGMVVTAKYSNGKLKQITDYSYSPTGALQDTITAITISYKERGITKTADVPVVVQTLLESIAVTKLPTKTSYSYNEAFVPAGMEVTATYSDGSTKLVSGWTVDVINLSTIGTQTITVTYTENNITKTTSFDVTVSAATLEVPTQSTTLTYAGSSVSPTWNNYNPEQLTIGGTTSAFNAGTYTASFTPKNGYRWSDNTTSTKNVTWQIQPAIWEKPVQTNEAFYNGSAQNVAQLMPDFEYIFSHIPAPNITGTTSANNAGTYTFTVNIAPNHVWPDNTTTATFTWTISPAQRVFTITAGNSNVSIDLVNQTAQNGILTITGSPAELLVSYTGNDGGNVLAQVPSGSTNIISSATSTASDFLQTSLIELTLAASGTAILNLTVPASLDGNWAKTTYNMTVHVTVADVGPITDSWETISQRSLNGQARNYYSIGSYKNVEISETLVKTFSGSNTTDQTAYQVDTTTLQAFIIGFDHNIENEYAEGYYLNSGEASGYSPSAISGGTRNHMTHFQLGKINNKLCAVVESSYGGTYTTSNPLCFIQNQTATQDVGDALWPWVITLEGKSITIPNADTGNTEYSWLYILPDDLSNVLLMTTKAYANRTSSVSSSFGGPVLNNDKRKVVMCPLSEYEYTGANNMTYNTPTATSNRTTARSDLQYEYYVNGNSRKHCKYNNASQDCIVWCRGIYKSGTTDFVTMQADGTAGHAKANISYGISPVFFV